MRSIHARDNILGVSGAELECTVRYRDLLYARRGVRYHRSHRNRLKSCAYSAGKTEGVGCQYTLGNPQWPQGDPSRMWPRVTRYDQHKQGTNQDPSVSPKPGAIYLIYNLLYNYQFTRIAGVGRVQEVRSTRAHEYQKYISLYIIQDNRYRIPVNVIIIGQVLT